MSTVVLSRPGSLSIRLDTQGELASNPTTNRLEGLSFKPVKLTWSGYRPLASIEYVKEPRRPHQAILHVRLFIRHPLTKRLEVEQQSLGTLKAILHQMINESYCQEQASPEYQLLIPHARQDLDRDLAAIHRKIDTYTALDNYYPHP